jgi:hypothetical protein
LGGTQVAYSGIFPLAVPDETRRTGDDAN